ncbi:TonB-dependent receptor [[Flexibacter] sp. ATCC 35208]|uniref:TonB-dependent receptor n=1 Tax=[Flexibacter] sp. ATCC 35208 TaxID=1936242 RepID=UPI0009F9503A|nr:TonB-dependent receptor [[Flexibacter] sp. ATCC 35208]
MRAILALIGMLMTITAHAQLTGKVVDPDTGTPVPGASVLIKSTTTGALTDTAGVFHLPFSGAFPVKLVVTYVGYGNKEVVLKNASFVTITLSEKQITHLNDVVVTASRHSESILRSPVTIEKLSSRQLAESPAVSAYEAISSLKGVNTLNTSLLFTVYNTRGFQNPTNLRFVQLVDGMDNQSPVLNFPIANTIGAGDLDVESVELIPGASSALYGLSATNGLVNTITKDPWLHQGLSFNYKGGVNNLHNPYNYVSPSAYTSISLRYAKAISDRLAFKVNFAYTRGSDWASGDTARQTNLNAGIGYGSIGTRQDPGYNGVNVYGDESYRTLTLNSQSVVVSRTGYKEAELTDYASKLLKADATLVYKFNNDTRLSYSYKGGIVDNIFTRANKLKFKNYTVQQHGITFKSPVISYKGYVNTENSGDSYNIRFLADNINRTWKSDSQWYSDFTTAFNSNYSSEGNMNTALQAARTAADNGRIEAGTTSFNHIADSLKRIGSWTSGAKFISRGYFIHNELQADLSKWTSKILDVQIGADYRFSSLRSDGTFYPDTTGSPITTWKGGAFVQLSREIIPGKLKATGSVRYDKAQYIDGQFTSRLGLVYSPTPQHNFRLSFQNGYRMPVFQDAWANLRLGTTQVLGGIKQNLQSYDIIGNSYFTSSITAFNTAVNKAVNAGTDRDEAIQANKSLLVAAPINYIKPEKNLTFELGYKGSLLNDKLFVDVSAFWVQFDGFIQGIGVGKVNLSSGISNDSLAAIAVAGGNYSSYSVYTNTPSKVYNYGVSLGVDYVLPKDYHFSANATYNGFDQAGTKDAYLSSGGFNTPSFSGSFSLGNTHVYKNFGFNVAYRWSGGINWVSSIANGYVPAWGSLDAQVSYHIPAAKSTIRIGGSNILNKYYTQYMSGPSIGGLYYASFTFDELFSKKH